MRFIKGLHIFSGTHFFADDMVIVLNENGTILDILQANTIDASKIEYHDGIITPGFINTHCHLELSHLKDKIHRGTGIVDFGLSVIKQRNDISIELQQEFMLQADKEMQENGIVAVGDISNSALSVNAKKQSLLYYHTFVELIGLNPERADLIFDAGKDILNTFKINDLSVSLAPHAPYSSSLQLIKKTTDFCESIAKPTTIHNQESKAENEFFKNKTGNYIKLYETLGLPITYFNATGTSSLQTVIPAFNKTINTLLVHNTFTDRNDIKIAQHHHNYLYWCMCANANLYIEKTLPPIETLIAANCNVTLGTDSLASNSYLSIIEEINCLLAHTSNLNLEFLLKAATYNGAKFLGIENAFGLLEKGKMPGINILKKEKEKFTVKRLG